MSSTVVVVPVHEVKQRLHCCIRALVAQKLEGGLSIIVSLDGDVALPFEIASIVDKVVIGPRAGPASARNRGWRALPSDFVLFTDSDCVPAEGWAAFLTGALEKGADGVKGVYSSGGEGLIQRLQQVEFEERYSGFSPGCPVDMIDTYSSGFRRSALEACNGFDESFPAADHEDVDLSYRMASMGFQFVFEPRAKVEHEHRNTLAGYFRLKFSRGRWRSRIQKLHPSSSATDRYVPHSLRAQIILTAVLIPVMIGGLLSPLIPAAWLFMHAVSTIPMAAAALRTDPPVTPAVPFFAFVRGLGLTAGLAAGFMTGGKR